MKQDTRVLFVSAFHAPFIQDDLDILEPRFHVRRLIGSGVVQIFRILFAVPRSDVIVCWFASVYGAVATIVGRFFGVKTIIILGGVDVAKHDELKYGLWRSAWKSGLVRSAIVHAGCVAVGDLSLRESAIKLAGYDGRNILSLPPGFDNEFWKPVGEKESIVLTVAAVRDSRRLMVKGIDVLIEAARILPNIRFQVVGLDPRLVAGLGAPANMWFEEAKRREDLLPLYRKAKVYCQPSRIEAVSYTLREAMLCGCLPVVSDVGGMPTAVAGIGYLVPPADTDALVAALHQAMASEGELAGKSRARIVALYPREKRVADLVSIVERHSQ